MDIQFINSEEWGIKTDAFRNSIDRLYKEVPETEGVLNVVFIDDSYIRSLNKNYRHKDKPTDVLSFSYLDTPDFNEGTDLIGEIYISIPTARRQAETFKWKLSDELNKLFVHGFLHVFGYDHETDEDYIIMSTIEKRVLGESISD